MKNSQEIVQVEPVQGTVYLLHFSGKLAHAQHYLGWSKNLRGRLYHHRKGTSAKLLRAVIANGLDFEVARKWKNQDRNFERRLKNQKKARRLCPICKSAAQGREV